MERYTNSTRTFKIDRYPETTLSSLKPWNAADEYIVSYIAENQLQGSTAIVNDRFGFLALALQHVQPTLFIDYKSQEKAIHKNLSANDIQAKEYTFSNILTKHNSEYQLATVKVPKSLELFSLYLQQLSQMIAEGGKVICGFMTKYFTPSMLEVASRYFAKSEQSRAWKKSRLLILSEPIKEQHEPLTETVPLPDGNNLTQYKGVFSSGKMDVGTRFLLEHLKLSEAENTVLDLACGNGIIGYFMMQQNPNLDLFVMDDFYLAVESARINIPTANCVFNNDLNEFSEELFDVIITNPPFHFGHETNIEVSLDLFRQTTRCLKNTGRFVIVANKHLNYASHLRKMYKEVHITEENEKFQVIECHKPEIR